LETDRTHGLQSFCTGAIPWLCFETPNGSAERQNPVADRDTWRGKDPVPDRRAA